MTWQYGTVQSLAPHNAVRGWIAGDNGTRYAFRDNSFAPEDRAHALKVGQRVRFEDRQGYVFDLRVVGGQA